MDDDALGSLESEPEEMDNPLGESKKEETPGDEPLKRVLRDSKEDRESMTVYIDPERRFDIDDLVNQYKREFQPKPRALDVYAAIIYAGMPDGPDTPRAYLTEFGYQES